jgi:MFS family permease
MTGSSALSLLRSAPDLRRLVTARLVSEAGTWLAYVALAVDVYARTGSAAWIGALLLVQELAMLVVGSALGALVDRMSRKLLLVVSDLLAAAVFGALAVAGNAAAIVALAGLAGAVRALYQPALAAAMPNLVENRDLPAANALSQTVMTGGLALGPLLGGVLIAAVGPSGAYVGNAASFLASAALLLRIPGRRLQVGRSEPSSYGAQILESLRLFGRGTPLRSLLASWTAVSVAFAATNVAEIVLARHVLGAGAAGYGLLASACGGGLVVGGFLSPRALAGRPPLQVYAAALAVGTVGFAATAMSPSLAFAVVSVIVAGIGNGTMLAARTLVVQRAVPDAIRGRAFAVLLAAGQASMVAGMLGAGVAVDVVGARAVWGGAALLLALAAAPALRPARAVPLPAEAV